MSNNKGLFENEYDLKNLNEFYDSQIEKKKRIAGEFKKSYYNDNS